MQKDWLEDLVVRETMKLIQDDAVIDKIVQLVMDVQNQENTTIPLLEKQLREVNKKLDNLMKAIEDGLYTRTTKERLEALEIKKDELTALVDSDDIHCLMIAASGAGKTVLLNFLLCSAQKYRDKDHQLSVILFDKDKGAELAIKAMGGGYLAIENGKPSGINPFQLEPTAENIQFLIGWTKRLIGRDGLQITPLDEQRIATAVETVMSMPAKYRRLAVLPQSLQRGDRVEDAQNSLTMRLSKWIETGPLAWAFDNEINTLDLNEFPNFGIDGTDFLENEDVRGPITEILLYLIETQVMKDKRRTIIVMDEFWKYLSDPATAQFAFDKLKTIRKQNGIFVFASQSPEDVLKSERGSAFVDNTATKIYLPNPYANEKDYTEGFKCTKDEFSIIKSLDTQSRLMLIKQGPVSVMIRLDLGNFKRALKIFSGTAGTTKFGEKLFSLVGDDPEVWIPYFFGDKPLPTSEKEEA